MRNEFFTGLNRIQGTIFLCSNRQPRGNIYSISFKRATSSKARANVVKENRENTLDWHSTVIYFFQGDLFYFDSSFDPHSHTLPIHCRTIRCLQMRSRLTDFIQVIESHGLHINRIMATGLANTVDGICRNLAIEFIKDLIGSRIRGVPLTNYKWVELVKGPREPSRDTLDIIEEI